MNKTEELKKLFEEWKKRPLHRGEVFIEDGIIDIHRWNKSSKKILIFLKEAYGEDKSWSLTDTILNDWKGPYYKIWWTISYWLYVLNKTTLEFIPFFPDSKEFYQECTEYLLSSAVVNIKKSGGKSASNWKELKEYATIDKEYLKKQIEIIEPNIILCGYTLEILKTILDCDTLEPKANTDAFIYEWNKTIFIDYWHPANHYPHRLCYYTLGHIYQRYLQRQ